MCILDGIPLSRNQGYFHASWMGRKGLFDHPDRLLTLLQLAGEFHSSDSKDKVYGLFGFSAFRERPKSFVPDYRESLKKVYCETARLAIASTMDLSVLYFVIHGDCIDDDFPSWVPRWDYQRKTWGSRLNWCLSRGFGLSIGPHGQSDILRLKGLLFDTVITVIRNYLPGAALGFGYSDNHKNKEWQGYAAMAESCLTGLRLRRRSSIFSLVSPRDSKNHPVNKY